MKMLKIVIDARATAGRRATRAARRTAIGTVHAMRTWKIFTKRVPCPTTAEMPAGKKPATEMVGLRPAKEYAIKFESS